MDLLKVRSLSIFRGAHWIALRNPNNNNKGDMKIRTKAELKRLPIGQELILTYTLLGPCHKPRKIKEQRSRDIVMQLPTGELSFLTLRGRFEATQNGFRFWEDGTIACEYVFN